MSVEERLKDPVWYDVVSRVAGFDAATLVTNADHGHILDFGGLTDVRVGVLTITPERVGYAYAGKREISQATKPVQSAELSHNGTLFIIAFGNPNYNWSFDSADHAPYLDAFKRARGFI